MGGSEHPSHRPTDLGDHEWERLKPLLSDVRAVGRPVETDLRQVLNAILYLAERGGGWRTLPDGFPPWQTVYWWFRRLAQRFAVRSLGELASLIESEGSARRVDVGAAWRAPDAPNDLPHHGANSH